MRKFSVDMIFPDQRDEGCFVRYICIISVNIIRSMEGIKGYVL